MAVFAVRIIKSTLHEGATREFGNTYHYFTDLVEPFPDAALATALKNAERLITASNVAFKGWQTWGPTDGSPLANVMRETGVFNENGQAVNSAGMYNEVCAVIAWPLPRSEVFNRRRWLRKFIRMPGYSSSLPPSTIECRAPVAQSIKDVWQVYANTVRSPNILGLAQNSLVTKDGVSTTGPGIVRDFLKTREIGR